MMTELNGMKLLTYEMRTKEEQCRDKWDKWKMFNTSTVEEST